MNTSLATPNTDDAVQVIIAARDMCGDERRALKDWEAENGALSGDDRTAVLSRVESVWDGSRAAAGAAVLSPGERSQAFRDLR